MTSSEARTYLDSFANYELKSLPDAQHFDLRRVHQLLSFLGNPQKKIKFLHIAGTKGKGSTCVFVAYILRAAGYRVGLYTSPHFYNFAERIRILNPWKKFPIQNYFSGTISETHLLHVVKDIKSAVEKVKKNKKWGTLTFFEVYTVLAIYYFAKQRVDFAVLETGLGGRLDATNCVDAIVCAITSISLEHTDFLGTTIKSIAREKSGIIKKKDQIVIIAPQKKDALTVIKNFSGKIGSRNYFLGKDIRFQREKQDLREQVFHLKGLRNSYRDLKTSLLGRHQIVNAATAIGMVESLSSKGFFIDASSIRQGIREALWPGRFEIIKKNPYIVLDGAHNKASAAILARTVKEIFKTRKVILILGISNDKDISGICRELGKIAKKIILTKAAHPRAFEFSDKDKKRFPRKEVIMANDVKQAMDEALASSERNDIILVAGSLFIAAEARKLCVQFQ
ncbi:MAG: folylpolyglutamate synthase/dihydrofolate synthase family protein [Candidatus Omnitrophota bacterium]